MESIDQQQLRVIQPLAHQWESKIINTIFKLNCFLSTKKKFNFREILEKGGSVVDAAIATMLANSVHNSQSMGIGGGFFMLHYSRFYFLNKIIV